MRIAQSKVTSQGQISIPASVRKDLAIRPGMELIWEKTDNGEYLVRPKKYQWKDLHQVLNGIPMTPHTDEEILEARRMFLQRGFHSVQQRKGA